MTWCDELKISWQQTTVERFGRSLWIPPPSSKTSPARHRRISSSDCLAFSFRCAELRNQVKSYFPRSRKFVVYLFPLASPLKIRGGDYKRYIIFLELPNTLYWPTAIEEEATVISTQTEMNAQHIIWVMMGMTSASVKCARWVPKRQLLGFPYR